MQAVELYADASRGIYIPQHFAQTHNELWNFDKCESDALDILLHGPEHTEYWEAWQDVIDNAFYQLREHKYTLWSGESGDLFSVCNERMTDSEYENFYGESRE